MVIGQADFISGLANRGGPPAANTLKDQQGSPAVASTGQLYLPDRANNRVLGYHTVPTANGAPADFVLGQPDFSTTTPLDPPTATGMRQPMTVVTYQSKLFVVDYDNHRVLIWNQLPTSSNVPADVVVGQPNKTTRSPACTAAGLNGPIGMAVIDGKLIVADGWFHRLLVWNSIPTTDGVAADLVLGQDDFTHCANGTTATRFRLPAAIVTIGGRLVVADSGNHRVLIWNTVPTCTPGPCASTTGADVVLGQPDFTTGTVNTGGVSAGSLYAPNSLATDGTRLVVADLGNQRVLIWNTVPTALGPLPDVVLGQPDFTSSAEGLSAQGLSWPNGVYFNGPNQLFVLDAGNNRSLIF